MTPLMLSKRMVKHLQQICENPPRGSFQLPPNHMNIHEVNYIVPSTIATALGPKVIETFRLRSGFTVGIWSLPGKGTSHKHSYSHYAGIKSLFLVYVGVNPVTLEYWDPRTNRECSRQLSWGETFVLSTHHKFWIDNELSDTPARFVTVNCNQNWDQTAKHFQHRW